MDIDKELITNWVTKNAVGDIPKEDLNKYEQEHLNTTLNKILNDEGACALAMRAIQEPESEITYDIVYMYAITE